MYHYLNTIHERFWGRIILSTVTMSFVLSMTVPPMGFAQVVTGGVFMPAPGTMIVPSPGFTPATLRGVTIHPENPLLFDFFVYRGDDKLQKDELKAQSEKLVKYFLATLTIPEDDLWVNLSPYEKDRIIPNQFGLTDMGRDMLAQDYLLKHLSATFMHPDQGVGQEFWTRVYQKASDRYGTIDIPVNTFNKIWIIPEDAQIYEHNQTAIITGSRLKVMLEEDYLAMQRTSPGRQVTGSPVISGDRVSSDMVITEVNSLGSQIVKEVILPEIEKEINEGKQFATLRQIYHAMILATWYKMKFQETLLGQIYVNQNKTGGIDPVSPEEKQKIYDQYIESFKKGVFDFIKEEEDPVSKEMMFKKYFSGGISSIGVSRAGTGAQGLGSLIRGRRVFSRNVPASGRRATARRVTGPDVAMLTVALVEENQTALKDWFRASGAKAAVTQPEIAAQPASATPTADKAVLRQRIQEVYGNVYSIVNQVLETSPRLFRSQVREIEREITELNKQYEIINGRQSGRLILLDVALSLMKTLQSRDRKKMASRKAEYDEVGANIDGADKLNTLVQTKFDQVYRDGQKPPTDDSSADQRPPSGDQAMFSRFPRQKQPDGPVSISRRGASELVPIVQSGWEDTIPYEDIVSDVRVVMLGDTNHDHLSLQRSVPNLFAGLREGGITHFGIELPRDEEYVEAIEAFNDSREGELNSAGVTFASVLDGLMSRTWVPHRSMSTLVEARKSELRIVPLDLPHSQASDQEDFNARAKRRGIYMGERIAEFLNQDKNAKMAALVGMGHLEEQDEVPAILTKAELPFRVVGMIAAEQPDYRFDLAKFAFSHAVEAAGHKGDLGFIRTEGVGVEYGYVHFPHRDVIEVAEKYPDASSAAERLEAREAQETMDLVLRDTSSMGELITLASDLSPSGMLVPADELAYDSRNWRAFNRRKIFDYVFNVMDGLSMGQRIYLAVLLESHLADKKKFRHHGGGAVH